MTIVNFPACVMLKRISVAGSLLLGGLCFMWESSHGQTEPENKRIAASGQEDLEKVYKRLKEQKKDKDIEIYYTKETIIKEPVEKDEYLNHLIGELRKSLKKGKRWGAVRRVEGRLVEIDKGAVHKIHERDVYIVHDSSGRYKSKLEVEAIADAISIGTSYEQKETIEPGDTVKFRGQRKLLQLGVIYGFSEMRGGYSGLGMTWEYTLRSGWGIDFLVTSFTRTRARYLMVEDYREIVNIPLSLGVRKYFYYPFWVSPFAGLGGSYLKIDHTRILRDEYFETIEETKVVELIPYFVIGTQFSGEQFHVNLEARYFHGSKLNVEPEPLKVRPIIYCASISFTW